MRAKDSREKEKLPCGRPSSSEAVTADHGPANENLLQEVLQQLDHYVTKKGLNRSESRIKVLKMIVREAKHFRAPELLERLQKRHPEVGKATLYRNLPVFVESGILQEGPSDSSGQIFYELSYEDHHDHIVCSNCGKIFEFQDEIIEKQQNKIIDRLHFKLQRHHHVIYAACEYLENKKK